MSKYIVTKFNKKGLEMAVGKVESQFSINAIYLAFGKKAQLQQKVGNVEYYKMKDCKVSFKVEEIKEVHLTAEDIIRIAKYFYSSNKELEKVVGFDVFHHNLFRAIKEVTQVDFFEE